METLDKHFRDLTRAAFARYGFAAAELFGRWPEIVGPPLAAHSAPVRITWPRGAGEDRQKTGGTLIVRAAPGRALELSYAAPRIIDEVNRFHGFAAIAAIKVMTAAAWPETAAETAPPIPARPAAEPLISTVADEALQAALRRLGAGVTAKASPQGK